MKGLSARVPAGEALGAEVVLEEHHAAFEEECMLFLPQLQHHLAGGRMGKAELIGCGLFAVLLGLPLIWGAERDRAGASDPIALVEAPRGTDLRQVRKDTLRVLVLSDPLTWEQLPAP
ncbi:MAG: hypothetical protein IPH00_15845 [Flavobacteriales bacterium]|nr:hypothetical protein [Flavobacteriales bacterium]